MWHRGEGELETAPTSFSFPSQDTQGAPRTFIRHEDAGCDGTTADARACARPRGTSGEWCCSGSADSFFQPLCSQMQQIDP